MVTIRAFREVCDPQSTCDVTITIKMGLIIFFNEMIQRNILHNRGSDIATQCTVDYNMWKIKTLLTRSITFSNIIKYW